MLSDLHEGASRILSRNIAITRPDDRFASPARRTARAGSA
jgi:hypothetical protein